MSYNQNGKGAPTAPPSAPLGYPNQQQFNPYQPAPAYGSYGAPGGPPLGPPPPYMAQSPSPGAYASPPMCYPAMVAPPMGAPAMGAPPPYGAPYQGGAPTTVFMPTGFDSGARFDGASRANIPPPPPGIAPNAAQMAMMQGQNVVLGQKKENFLTGGKGGGYTFW